MPIGDHRRKVRDTLQEKDRLEPVEDPETLDELKQAVEDTAVDGVIAPDEQIVERMESVYETLPEDAKQQYVQDDVLLRRINAYRRQFNEWNGRKLRECKMPGPAEAGPSNYPTKKLRKRQRSERNAYEELQEKEQKVKAAAKGARQRALNAIGSSVAEQNEQKRESIRDRRRDQLSEDDIVQFRNPSLEVGRVVRVNKKTVTVEYERGMTENPLTSEELDPMAQTRVDLDSQFLTLLDVETLEDAQEQMEDGGQ